MAQKSVDDPYQAVNQGLPAGSKLDSQGGVGTGSPINNKQSPARAKEAYTETLMLTRSASDRSATNAAGPR
jgi:hypothetical protein